MLSYQTAYLAMIGLYAGIWLFFFVKEKYVRKEMLIVSLAAMPLGITMPLYADCCRAEYVFPIAPHLGLEDFAWAFSSQVSRQSFTVSFLVAPYIKTNDHTRVL